MHLARLPAIVERALFGILSAASSNTDDPVPCEIPNDLNAAISKPYVYSLLSAVYPNAGTDSKE